MSEGNSDGETPRTPTHMFLDLEAAERNVEDSRRRLSADEAKLRECRQRIIGLLKAANGPIAWDQRLFVPVHDWLAHGRAGRVVDYRTIEFSCAYQLDPLKFADLDVALATAARDFTPAPELPSDEPPPFGVEPRDRPTAREAVHTAWGVVLASDGEG